MWDIKLKEANEQTRKINRKNKQIKTHRHRQTMVVTRGKRGSRVVKGKGDFNIQ